MFGLNVHGLGNKFLNFFKYINSFEIIILCETFVTEEKYSQYLKYFVDFETKWIHATKTSSRGRPSGGMVYGFRRDAQAKYGLKFENISGITCVSGTFQNLKLSIVPIYLNNNADWDSDFEKIANLVKENSQNFMLVGDFNSRTKNWQTYDSDSLQSFHHINSIRNSEDSKNVDSNGKKLLKLCDDFGLIMLNGRSRSDADGKNTFIASMGTSVIDYSIVSIDALHVIKDFRVEAQQYSDHLPIITELETWQEVQSVDTSSSNPMLLPKCKWSEAVKNNYSNRIMENMNVIFSQSPADTIEDKSLNIINTIKASIPKQRSKNFTPKEKWFDYDCFKKRESVLKSLNLCRKFPLSLAFRKNYLERKKGLALLCEQKKKDYFIRFAIELKNVRNPKEWWRLVNSMRQKPLNYRCNITTEVFSQYFVALFSPEILPNSMAYAEPHVTIDPLDRPFTILELKEVLQDFKDNREPGLDRIPYEFYKNAPLEFLLKVLEILNEIFESGITPKSFHRQITKPIHKKGDVNTASNYRGLAFLDSLYKIYTALLLKRLLKWDLLYNILNECQTGFRKTYSTSDNIFSLMGAAEYCFKKGKKLYAFYVDFSAAFDTINRQLLFYKLSQEGLSTKMLNALKQIYSLTEMTVYSNGELSNFTKVKHGVKQGCLLSPFLFSVYLNDLKNALTGGLKIGKTILKLLMYADDLVLLAETVEDLQTMINQISEFCRKWGLKINLSKSKTMIFRRGKRVTKNEKWQCNGLEIENVDTYRYLGIDMKFNLSLDVHFSNKLTEAKNSLNATWKNIISQEYIPFSTKLAIFRSSPRAMMCHAAQSWGYKPYETVEQLQRWFIKRVFNLPENTPSYMLEIEASLNRLFIFTLKLHFAFVHKTMSFQDNRISKLIAKVMIEENISWAKEWSDIFLKHRINFNFQVPITDWPKMQKQLIQKLIISNQQENISKAINSQYHDPYPQLKYYMPTYFNDSNSRKKISYIFRARCGLMKNDYSRFKTGVLPNCTICDKNEPDDSFHIIGRCPIMKFVRAKYFGKFILTNEEVLNELNGNNFENLFNFVNISNQTRNIIINDFNF